MKNSFLIINGEVSFFFAKNVESARKTPLGIHGKNQKEGRKTVELQTLKEMAKSAKSRMKKGFWKSCEETVRAQVEEAKKQGVNESKAERYFIKEAQKAVAGEKEDGFYLRVKELLLSEGERSDAIGRLTDREYFEALSYEEKQRYTLALSEKYLRALERFRKESEFAFASSFAGK